ncbi:MAG: hypothetical protein HY286_10455 [Planctomycetes bacterium]|nr:hypothetical protein [Planctomycetota bacterium]
MPKPRKFQFTLERVLNVREAELSIERQKVAQANARLNEANSDLSSARAAHGRAMDELAADRRAEKLDIFQCLQSEAACDRVLAAVAACETVVESRLKEREIALAAYTESYKNVKTLERLREVRHAGHTQERRAWETKMQDEVASNRAHARSTRESQ